MNDFLFIALLSWLFGSQVTYLYGVRKYMKKYNIKDINKTTKKHANNLQSLYLYCLHSWYKFWINNKE